MRRGCLKHLGRPWAAYFAKWADSEISKYSPDGTLLARNPDPTLPGIEIFPNHPALPGSRQALSLVRVRRFNLLCASGLPAGPAGYAARLDPDWCRVDRTATGPCPVSHSIFGRYDCKRGRRADRSRRSAAAARSQPFRGVCARQQSSQAKTSYPQQAPRQPRRARR